MYRLSTTKRTQVISALCEGVSVNAITRMTGVSKVTTLKLLSNIGPVLLDFQRKTLVDLPCKRIQCDEIWSFVGAKEKNVPLEKKGPDRGDVWIWAAICDETKIVPCWHVGPRDADAAAYFMEDLASRLAHRIQLTTDGHRAYLSAVEGAFGWSGVDYAMLVKIYGPSPEGTVRYSPAEVISTEKHWIMGKPETAHISTSFVERQNLTMRMNIRRLTRLTNGHSKKIENHRHAMSLHYAYYNFVRKHETLVKKHKGYHWTPAMEAGLTNRVWKVQDLVRLLEDSEKVSE